MKIFPLLLTGCLFFTGCETVLYNKEMNTTKLEERVNDIQENFKLIIADNPDIEGYQPWIFDSRQVKFWFADRIKESGSYPIFSPISDDKYFVLEYENATQAIKLFSKFIWKYHYKNSSRDCDDYAFAFRSWLQFFFADTYDSEASAPVAILYVNQQNDFANIKGGENMAHALIGIGTDRGAVIMEPQNGIFVFLQDYPNKAEIFYVIQ